MLQKMVLVLLIVLLPAYGYSQVTWGAKGGANITTLGGFNSGNNPQLRAHGGFFYQQHIESQYGLAIELQYSIQGARAANISRRYFAYHYLNLPVLLKFYTANTVYIAVGPQLGYLLFAQFHDDGFKQNITDQVKRFDFAGVLGAGKETDFGNFGARAGFGFTNTSGASVGNSVVFRNLFLQLYVGVTIGQLNN